MRELTNALPKPMLSVQGKPVLQHIIEGLRDSGLSHFQIIIGWYGETIQEFFGDGSNLRTHVEYATQVVQDGTGKVIELARPFVGNDPFVLSYGDILIAPQNYPRICAALNGAEAVVSVKRNEDVTQGGAVFVNENLELIDLREKPKPGEQTSPWYNAGIYAFRSSIFDHVAKLERSARGEYELTDAIRNLALSGNKVRAFELEGNWADVRDPETLAKLNR